jgi:hypothetical protein
LTPEVATTRREMGDTQVLSGPGTIRPFPHGQRPKTERPLPPLTVDGTGDACELRLGKTTPLFGDASRYWWTDERAGIGGIVRRTSCGGDFKGGGGPALRMGSGFLAARRTGDFRAAGGVYRAEPPR